MAMDDAEAQRQIQQMVNFILNEAKDKAQEIEAKALEDFNIEKLKLVQQMKDTIRQEYQKKAKHQEMQRSIARSTAINKAKLRKIAARDQVVKEVCNAAAAQLVQASSKPETYEKVVVDLLVQGALRLLEDALIVRCRECDKAVVERAIPKAAAKYSEVLRRECGVAKTVSMKLDLSGRYLPPSPGPDNPGLSCIGGVVLMTPNGKITCDNTFDARLRLVMQDCSPAIRSNLFSGEGEGGN